MLLNIRDIVTGWLATFIVAVLIIPFAFLGVNFYFSQGGSQNVAMVNDRAISIAEFQQAYQNYRRQLQNALGDRMETLNSEFLRQETLNRLIETEILLELAREIRMRISDESVVEGISRVQAFHDEEGRFDQNRYQLALQRAGITSSGFEQQMRTDMLLRQLQNAVVESAFVTEAAVTQLARIEAQKRDIVYATIKSRPIYNSIEISDADIRSYYENNIQNYRTQPKVKIDYIDLTIDSLTDDVSVSEEDLRAYYESNKSSYTVEETRKVTQMYINLPEDAGQARVDKARQTMEFIQEKLAEGMTMEEIATAYEDRLGPDFEQISLGHTPKGVMAPKLDEVVFAMEEDETSDILRSDVGMHIVRLDDIRGGKTSDFESVREQVESDYRRRQAEQLFFEYADRLATVTYENPHTLEVAAEDLDLSIHTSDWFTESGGEGIAAESKVVTTSFSSEILQEELNSEPIELGNSRIVVLRKADYQPAQAVPLEDVRDEIIDDLKNERAREKVAERGEVILQALRNGQSRESIAAQYNIEWQQGENVTREDVDINRSVLRTAFSITPPADDGIRYQGAALGSGDYIIVGVTAVTTPAADSIGDERRAEVRQQLMRMARQDIWQLMIDNARSGMEITVNRQNTDI